MKRIPDGSVDCIICDLPYGTTRNPWDSVIPLDLLWAEYRRICKPTAPIVLFSQQPFTSALVMSNPSMFRYEWIWQKENGTGHLNAKKMPMKEHENIVVFYDKLPTYNPIMKQGEPYRCKSGEPSSNYGSQHSVETINNGERYPTTIVQFDRDADGFHPTQKPVDLLRYLVLTYTNEGDTVLDNCSGSGTTAVACVKEKRHFICFEKDETYWKKSVERVKNEKLQLTLF
jgi:site-specific DNA-methyltransferase (adenine-specific)